MTKELEEKLNEIRRKNKTQEYESMWETDCPYCGVMHIDILDGIPLNVDNGCHKTHEMIMGWRLKGIREKGRWLLC